MVHFGTPRVGPIHTPNIGPIDPMKSYPTPQILDPSMKDWYQYPIDAISWNLTHRVPLRKSVHMTYHTMALLPNSCGPMADGPFRDPKGRSYPHPKYWTHRESRHMTYHTAALLPRWPNGGWSISGPTVLSTHQILDPSMKDWYQYRPWNLTHRVIGSS